MGNPNVPVIEYVEMTPHGGRTAHLFDGTQHWEGPLISACKRTYPARVLGLPAGEHVCQACAAVERRAADLARAIAAVRREREFRSS